MRSIFAAIMLAVFFTSPVCLAGTWASVETYPHADMFICGGGDFFAPQLNFNVWTTPGFEIGWTVGPKLGPFTCGLGMSYGQINSFSQTMFINTDLTLNPIKIGRFTLNGYHLAQFGQHGVESFYLLRDWLVPNGSPVGLMQHSTKCGSGSIQWRPGMFIELGQIGPISSNRICVAYNLSDGADQYWFALICSF